MMTNLPRPEYPRPQLRRQRWINLNGDWNFRFDDDYLGCAGNWHLLTNQDRIREVYDQRITVPFAPQSTLSGIADTGLHKNMWYSRTFNWEPQHPGHQVLLHFGAVDYRAKIHLNGVPVGQHTGGHTPFTCDLTAVIHAGENILTVQVEDPDADPSIPRGKQYWHQKSGHIYYTRTSGIWQTVWIEETHPNAVAALTMDGNPDTGQITTKIQLHHPISSGTVRITASRDQHPLAVTEQPAEGDTVTAVLEIPDGSRHPWSPDFPALYDLKIEVSDAAGHVVDSLDTYTALRRIDIKDRQILLNGERLYLRQVLDQGYWPDGIMTAPTDAHLKTDIELAQLAGFNGARKHQKIEDPRWHYWADRLGFLTWAEMANTHDFTEEGAIATLNEWQEAVKRDRNHPSIIAWVPMNESMGTRKLDPAKTTPGGPFNKHLPQVLYHATKLLDPTRPCISNDGWEHQETDLVTIHDYRGREGLEERATSLTAALESSGRSATFAPGYEYGNQPILLTEIGGIFISDHDSGLDYRKAIDAEHLVSMVTEIIKIIDDNPYLSGYCYTQLTDVEQENNGIYTADRKPKIPISALAAAQELTHPRIIP